ncbi:hypothetical protein [Nocardioides litoris]|uniref:hypothetical protein n=1 Tax=Nocardioides litoris TaxID=1926648 RepID=UPI0011201BF1|nr:hypothetical protein [Nocardioides litoris]
MALEQPSPDPLARAVAAARAEEPPATWPALAQNIRSKVRTVVGPSDPVLVRDASGATVLDADGSRTWVSTRVLLTLAREALTTATHAAESVRFDLGGDDGDDVVAVEVAVAVAYGSDIATVAADVRRAAGDLLDEQVGGSASGARPVHVEVVDVVEGDPRVV